MGGSDEYRLDGMMMGDWIGDMRDGNGKGE